jgi:predicted ATP-dependent Lon-type protease
MIIEEFNNDNWGDYPPSFSEYRYFADDAVNQLVSRIKNNAFFADESINKNALDTNGLMNIIDEIKVFIGCMTETHEESMANMQATIDNIIVQSNNKLMDKYCSQAANIGGKNGTV